MCFITRSTLSSPGPLLRPPKYLTSRCERERKGSHFYSFYAAQPVVCVCVRLGCFLRVIFRVLLVKRTMCRRIKELFIRQSITRRKPTLAFARHSLLSHRLDVLPRNRMTHSFDLSGTTKIPRKTRVYRRVFADLKRGKIIPPPPPPLEESLISSVLRRVRTFFCCD